MPRVLLVEILLLIHDLQGGHEMANSGCKRYPALASFYAILFLSRARIERPWESRVERVGVPSAWLVIISCGGVIGDGREVCCEECVNREAVVCE